MFNFFKGVLTSEKIYAMFFNQIHYSWNPPEYEMPDVIKKFFLDQDEYMKELYEKDPQDPYSKQVEFVRLQNHGLVNGYNSVAKDEEKIDWVSFQILTSWGDLLDLQYLVKERIDFSKKSSMEVLNFLEEHTSCSVLFKVLDDFSDVYFGHNTWFSYGRFTQRMFKEYNLFYKDNLANSILMSSYPGALGSIDDFYVTSQNLIVIETTNSVYNQSLYDLLTPQSLLYWQRILVSSRLSPTSKNWMEYFSRHNSGTYNNQWMVLDLKLFEKDVGLFEGAFYVAEQIPGLIVYEDQTDFLSLGYWYVVKFFFYVWPSFNIPFYREIYRRSGYEERIKEHPELKTFLSHQSCARAKIFRRDHSKVKNHEEMKKIMRYNDYRNDPFSFNSITKAQDPTLTIAARGDLKEVDPNCHGAYDAKFSTYEMWMDKKEILVIYSPPYEEDYIHPFSWTEVVSKGICQIEKYPHLDTPDSFEFDWLVVKKTDIKKKGF